MDGVVVTEQEDDGYHEWCEATEACRFATKADGKELKKDEEWKRKKASSQERQVPVNNAETDLLTWQLRTAAVQRQGRFETIRHDMPPREEAAGRMPARLLCCD